MELQHQTDAQQMEHLHEARRVLALPIAASGFHWHPFGVFTIPMAKREGWARRLHVWHPAGTPVGEASAYGVHTHSGDARSHVVAGTLTHHLYAFEPDPEGIWHERGTHDRMANLLAHVQAETAAGVTHSFPADQPHGVSKPPGFAISLFEQQDQRSDMPFTTWQRTDIPEEVLVREPPVALEQARLEALAVVDQALYVLEN